MPADEIPGDADCETLTLHDDAGGETGKIAQVGGGEEGVGEVFGDEKTGEMGGKSWGGEGEGSEGL